MNYDMVIRIGNMLKMTQKQIDILTEQITMLSNITKEQTELINHLNVRINELDQRTFHDIKLN